VSLIQPSYDAETGPEPLSKARGLSDISAPISPGLCGCFWDRRFLSQPSLELLPAAALSLSLLHRSIPLPIPGASGSSPCSPHAQRREERGWRSMFVPTRAALPHPAPPEPPQQRSEYSEVNSIRDRSLPPVMDALLGGDDQLVKQACLEFIQG